MKSPLRARSTPQTLTTGRLPSVNLLSAGVLEVAHLQQVRRRFITAALAVVTVTGVGFVSQQGLVMAAERDLAAVQQDNADLTAQKQDLAPVGRFYREVAANQDALIAAMAKESRHSQTLAALADAAPDEVTLTTVKATVDTAFAAAGDGAAAAAACPGPDPYNAGSAVGCITVVGKAPNRDTLGQFVENLSTAGTFVNPFVSSTTVDEGEAVSFTATVGLTDAVYSRRYSDAEFLKGGAR